MVLITFLHTPKPIVIRLILFIFLSKAFVAFSVPEHSHKDNDTLFRQGYALMSEGDYEQAAEIYVRIASAYDPNATEKERYTAIKAYSNLGYIFTCGFNSPERAYGYLLQGLNLAETEGQTDLAAAIYANMGKLYADFNDIPNALNCFKLSLQNARQKDTATAKAVVSMAFTDIASMALQRDITDSITSCIDLFNEISTRQTDISQYATSLYKAVKAVQQKDYDTAIEILEQSVPDGHTGIIADRDLCNHLITLSSIKARKGNTLQAIELQRQALDMARKGDMTDFLPQIYSCMATLYSQAGDRMTTDRYRLLGLEAADSLYCARELGKIQNMASLSRIDTLTQELQMAEVELTYRRRVIWILALCATVVLILGAILTVRSIRLKNSYSNLARIHRETVAERDVEIKLRQERYKGPGDIEEQLKTVEKIKDVMASPSTVCNPDFCLEQLATLVDSKPKYVSAIINDTMQTTFTRLLSEARIAEACRLLDSDIGRRLSMDSIAEKVGYRSRTHFSAVFKRTTGLTPGQYMATRRGDE
ncbi:MAG: AraC family transcriptional regulator [Muribaculaceae bacterium]|nr:AraC family transcriptional regulator [Muribaculaceae bacterium]